MNFRFTLNHSELGGIQINQPDGWRDAVLKLERHDSFHSLIEYFEGSFIFYGTNGTVDGGIDFIRQVEDDYGVDATLSITIEISENNDSWVTLFIGQLDLSTLEEVNNNKLKCGIIRDDFWANFINRIDTPVDIQSTTDLDGESRNTFDNISLHLTSQLIQKRFTAFLSFSVAFYDLATSDYVQVDWDTIDLDEIEEKFSIPIFGNPDVPAWVFEMEYGGDYDFDISLPFSRAHVDFGEPITATWEDTDGWIDLFIQVNEETPIQFSEANGVTSYGDNYTVFTYNDTLTIPAGATVRIYADVLQTMNRGSDGLVLLGNWGVGDTSDAWEGSAFSFDFEYEAWVDEDIDNNISVTGQTTFPENNAPSFFLHDVGGQIADRIIGQDQTFYSELLGSSLTKYRQYVEDGCNWKYVLTKGLQLRQYSLLEKPFFLSFKDWWEGVNPILNLGLGYDIVNNQTVINVEEKADFYEDSVSVYFSNIQDITRSHDNTLYFNKIDVGYTKWQSEDISGIDDPQTKHTYSTLFKKVGRPLQLFSSFMAASLGIEITRRKTRKKSADYKHDNETFIIAINPTPQEISPETSPDVIDYIPELDENFSAVSNLLNSDTRYNLRITPKRNLIRWLNYITMGLQAYLDSVLKFTAGEGNYDMVSTMDAECDEYAGGNLTESNDYQLSEDESTLFVSELFKMTIPMTLEEYFEIRNNRKKAIGISQTDTGFVNFYIKTLSYNPFAGQASVTAWPKTRMEIQVVDVTPDSPYYCSPAPIDSQIYRITQDGNFRRTEAGEYRIID